jgi:hypothetical protein
MGYLPGLTTQATFDFPGSSHSILRHHFRPILVALPPPRLERKLQYIPTPQLHAQLRERQLLAPFERAHKRLRQLHVLRMNALGALSSIVCESDKFNEPAARAALGG